MKRAARGVTRVLGLMSGTSCDGITVAGAAIMGPAQAPGVKCLGWRNQAYPKVLRARLLKAATPGGADAGEIAALHVELAEFWAKAAMRFAGGGKGLARYDLLASHGHTLHHQPPARGRRGYSFQVGDAATLCERTGLTVAHDFRPRDLALGGQGAPLVPRADQALFSSAREPRVALNIGGIANITILPRRGTPGAVMAFDTGPGNMVMDLLVARASRARDVLDRGGRRAAGGRVDARLLGRWLAHPFFEKHPPRSTGREDFGEVFVRPAVRAVSSGRLRWNDTLATAALLTAFSIASSVHAYAIPGTRTVVGAGGGMKNSHLVRLLGELLAPLRLVPSERLGVPGPAREALAFALLGYFTWNGVPGNLPAATGAAREAVLGCLTPGHLAPRLP